MSQSYRYRTSVRWRAARLPPYFWAQCRLLCLASFRGWGVFCFLAGERKQARTAGPGRTALRQAAAM